MTPRRDRPAHDRLLLAAGELFATQGINATGIDQIIERASVAKASLYNNFSGKDALVAAYLSGERERFTAQITRLRQTFTAPEVILELFSLIRVAAREPGFAGCPFSKAAVEVDPSSLAGHVIRAFYDDLGDFFSASLDCDRRDPRVRQLVVLYDGAMTSAKILRDSASVDAASALVEMITRAA
ncbi:MAG: TetR/AcrR family transcriptional regulator [Acidobacteriota bacterium]|nr:TetR/AcrR family transcriptional regulator [Acidobacteriota bacterium]